MKEKTRKIIIETGSIFRQNLALILKEKDRILTSPELYATHIPKLFIRNKFISPYVTLSPTIGGLLRIWDNGKMQTACPCCRSGIVYGYYLDIDETAHLFGVCASCGELVEFNVTGDDRFVMRRIVPSQDPDSSFISRSSITVTDLIRILSGEDTAPSEPFLTTALDISDEERAAAKTSALRALADRSIGVFYHMGLAKDREKYEQVIKERMEQFEREYSTGEDG